MTMTVKLDPALEQRLRDHSAATGQSASELIRQALTAWLGAPAAEALSPYSLGADLFGRHRGPTDLATRRKTHAADIWADKHARRG